MAPRTRAAAVGILILQTAFQAGCSDGGRPTAPAADSDPSRTPSLSLLTEPASVHNGGFVRLTWDAADAEVCEASGGWNGSRNLFGSEEVGPLDGDTTFILSCSNGQGDGVVQQVAVAVKDGAPPEVQLHAQQEVVPVNGITQLAWSAEQATRCDANGGWSGSQPLAGSVSVGPLTQTTTFGLTCRRGTGVALASITVEVMGSGQDTPAIDRNQRNPGAAGRYDG